MLSVLNHDCAVGRRGRADGHRRRGPAADRDGVAAHARGGRGRGGPGGLPGRVRRDVEPGGGPPLRHPDRRHRRARLHAAARRRAGRVPRPGRRRWARTRRCWSTPTTSARASRTRSRPPGRSSGAIRIDSGDLGVLARQAREQLDALGATGTRIVLSGDLDEYAIAALRAEPVDSYGVGTSVVTGSGAPTAGMVYKLVEVDGRPVAKRSASQGVARRARSRRCAGTSRRARRSRRSCTAARRRSSSARTTGWCRCRWCAAASRSTACRRLAESREHLRAALVSVPWEGLKLSTRRARHPDRRSEEE